MLTVTLCYVDQDAHYFNFNSYDPESLLDPDDWGFSSLEEAKHYFDDLNDGVRERLQLPVTLLDHDVTIIRCDFYDTIVIPSLDSNDLAVLRRALHEWDRGEWLGIDEQVEVAG